MEQTKRKKSSSVNANNSRVGLGKDKGEAKNKEETASGNEPTSREHTRTCRRTPECFFPQTGKRRRSTHTQSTQSTDRLYSQTNTHIHTHTYTHCRSLTHPLHCCATEMIATAPSRTSVLGLLGMLCSAFRVQRRKRKGTFSGQNTGAEQCCLPERRLSNDLRQFSAWK